ncbi:MAG: family 43 glycosylhydrolase [Chitinophagaceae bacterium]|nr:family 43 glycosylhydrolase [Chitinophagaceae bacterium]
MKPSVALLSSSLISLPKRHDGDTFAVISLYSVCKKLITVCRNIIFISLLFCLELHAQGLQNNTSVHDPVMIKQDSVYYIFCTGRGISCWSSTDMINWKKEKPVFDTAPLWADSIVAGFRNHIWAPDIFYLNNRYYIFYSVSAYGKNTSAIGVAVNNTLHPFAANYKWEDKGIMIRSVPGKSNFNAIDPNIIVSDSQPYLSFGSFWKGIMLVQLTNDLLRVADASAIINVASRKIFAKDTLLLNGAGNAIEAPYIFKKGNYYYLFASVDYCCKGKESTYKMIVGRADNIEGPYVDQLGKLMTEGGGSVLLKGDDKWYGVGHNAVVTIEGADYIVYHGYDAADNGKSKLRIEKLFWNSQEWPEIKR